MINPMELTGSKIFVAGASSETGRVIINTLYLLGAKVVAVDKFEEKPDSGKRKSDIGDIVSIDFDIYNNKEIETTINDISINYGPFNGFVYCAGTGGVRPLSLTKYSFTHEMMNANFYTFVEMVRCLTQKGNFADEGSIVAISSVSSIKGLKSKTAYSASKAALEAAVRCIAAELSNKRIRVNSVLKGWVTADMNKDFIKNNMDLNGNSDFKKQLLGAIEPEELAYTVAFLLCDATRTITGTSLVIDGGYTL